MKTWHWIAIGGAVLVVGYMLMKRSTEVKATAPSTFPTAKVFGFSTAGAPPLPNLSLAVPTTGKLFAFQTNFTNPYI